MYAKFIQHTDFERGQLMQRAEDIFAVDAAKQSDEAYARAKEDAAYAERPHSPAFDVWLQKQMAETDQLVAKYEKPIAQLWFAAPDYQSVIDLNRKFLLGKMPLTPYHSGPLYPDSQAASSGLWKMHDYGFLTFDGQGFMDKKSFKDYLGYWIWEQQRPYVMFLAPRGTTNDRFCEALLRSEHVYCNIFDSSNGTVCSNQKVYKWAITRGKNGPTKESLDNAEWVNSTNHGNIVRDGHIVVDHKTGIPTVVAKWAIEPLVAGPIAVVPAIRRIQPLQIGVAFRGPWAQAFDLEGYIVSLAKDASMKAMYVSAGSSR